MKRYFLSLMLMVVLAFLSSCSDDCDDNTNNPAEPSYNTPKYIIFLIGDGMANPQINVTEAALNDTK